jgi:5-methyltetrahydropteroyltriglutamate--homocysteine methyltransferase
LINTTVLGSYPKIPAHAGASVRQAIQRFDRRAIGPRALEDVFVAATARALSIFAAAGLTRITDGQIRWNDLTDPVVRDTDNLVHGGLQRFFDNNFYYRQPTVVGRLQYQGGVLAEWTRLAVGAATRPLKVSLPGPLTLLALTDDKTYRNREHLLADLIEVLALEAASVARAGAVEIEWDEPAAVTGAPVDPGEGVAAWTALLGANPAIEQSLAFYFGPAGQWLDRLFGTGVHRVYVDLVAEPSLVDRLSREPLPFEVGLGLIDARNVRLEDRDLVSRTVSAIAERQGSGRVWLHPNAGLEFLPPDRAEAKVRWLGTLAASIDRTQPIEEEGRYPHA